MPERPRPLVLLASPQIGELHDAEVALYSAGYRVLTARTEHEIIDVARTHTLDAFVLDDALNLSRALRSEPTVSPATPIIILRRGVPRLRLERGSGGEGEDDAWDIQPNPPDTQELLLRLGAYMQAKLEIDRLRSDCLIDRGSGLYNEHGFTQRATELAALMNRQHTAAACVVFQAAAPLPSPASGDRLGRAFKSAGRQSDAIGRTAAAEFAVFAPGTNELAAARLVNRLLDNVARRGGLPLKAGFSASQATQKAEPTALLSRARQSLRVL